MLAVTMQPLQSDLTGCFIDRVHIRTRNACIEGTETCNELSCSRLLRAQISFTFFIEALSSGSQSFTTRSGVKLDRIKRGKLRACVGNAFHCNQSRRIPSLQFEVIPTQCGAFGRCRRFISIGSLRECVVHEKKCSRNMPRRGGRILLQSRRGKLGMWVRNGIVLCTADNVFDINRLQIPQGNRTSLINAHTSVAG